MGGSQLALVEAKVVDSTHLELSKPIDTPRGRTVLVSVAESDEEDLERRGWLDSSTASLQSAYIESEPEYPLSMLRESNPDYAG
jgi:hypothetical protein